MRAVLSGDNLTKVLAGIWCAWCHRNVVTIGKKQEPLFKLIMDVNNIASLLGTVVQVQHRQCVPERWVAWHPSREDIIVLNVDGSSQGNPGTSGFGGLLRRGDGSWISGYMGFLGVTGSLHSELVALFHGLELAWRLRLDWLCCYSDSTCDFLGSAFDWTSPSTGSDHSRHTAGAVIPWLERFSGSHLVRGKLVQIFSLDWGRCSQNHLLSWRRRREV